jgi:hypothetical protein
MKTKITLRIAILLGMIAMAAAVKVDICHNVDNNPHTINIALPAAVAHMLQHPSDTFGSCEDEDNAEK